MGVLGGIGAALAGVGAVFGLGRRSPRPQVVAGTLRTVEAYGAGPLQRGEWWLPPGEDARRGLLPTVVLRELSDGGFGTLDSSAPQQTMTAMRSAWGTPDAVAQATRV